MARSSIASSQSANSSSEVFASTSVLKTRRSHTKSRKGCIVCKTRHIRCDERLPSCANCEIAERTCIFPPRKVGGQKTRPNQQHASTNRRQRAPATESGPTAIDSDNVDSDSRHTQVPLLALRSEMRTGPGKELGQSSRRLQLGYNALPIACADADLGPIPASVPSCVRGPDGRVHTPFTDTLPGISSASDAMSEATFTLQHIILLRRADTVPNFISHDRSIVDIAIRYAVQAPYLIDEVLAFTTFYLAHVLPGSARHLRYLATQLQTRALASFTHLTKDVSTDDKATGVPRFLFSALLGRHYLAETLTQQRSTFHSFIDGIIECFNLNRGIKAVTPRARDFLHDSELGPFINVTLNAQSKIASPGNGCDPLNRLMVSCDLKDTSLGACCRTVGLLQRSFDTLRYLGEADYPQTASTFSVHVESGFVDALHEYQPVALVILAYYAVLLHRCHSFWAFRDAGGHIVHAIAEYLGVCWQEPLTWPISVVRS